MEAHDRAPANCEVAGIGLGLRPAHETGWLDPGRDGIWLEVLADNYAHGAGPARRRLARLRERHPMVLHGVGMSLGSTDPIDRDYVERIGALAREIEAAWISDHLAWTSVAGRHHHDLLPLPFFPEAVETLVRNIARVQDMLGCRILVENSVAYVAFAASTLRESEFVTAVLEGADCHLLLDVSNLYVNARNHGYDPIDFLDALPRERVKQLHVGGFDDHGDLLVDAHGSAVAEPVWSLFAEAVARFPDTPACVEWDRDVPPLERLLDERTRAESLWWPSRRSGEGRLRDAS